MRFDPRSPYASGTLAFRFAVFGLIVFAVFMNLPNPRVIKAVGNTNNIESPVAPTAVGMIISEFRVRGANGPADEFIEISNSSASDHTVTSSSGTGYAVAASDGIIRCVIPNGTVFPKNGRFLCANTVGYSLGNYPAGNGSSATPDDGYTTAISDNTGIALFNNNTGGASFNLANRFDAVGSVAEPNALYKEGNGYPNLTTATSNYSWTRRISTVTGFPVDTDNNIADFIFADPDGTSMGAGQRLGAPSPQNQSSPLLVGTTSFGVLALDATRSVSIPPNRFRDTTPDLPNNSAQGTVSIRRRFVNQTGAAITRLRFRILDISTFPAPAGTADLRARSSTNVIVSGINDSATCAATGSPSTPPCTVTVQGTGLETPPAQANGGGFYSSLSANNITNGTPLANGASINLQFLFGVQQEGNYRLVFELEVLPGAGAIFQVRGNTSAPNANSDAINTVADFDGDFKSDLSVFRPGNGTWYLLQSQNGFQGTSFGLSDDRIVPADYDGDAKTDIAVYRPSSGTWYIIQSSTNTLASLPFGSAEDLPTPADYDGDGKADLCLFRPSNGTWYRINSSNNAFIPIPFGANGDRPTVGDYEGDGKADISLFRPSNGNWYRLSSSTGAFIASNFGTGTDITAPGDFDGDGRTDLSVFRPSNGTWYRLNSSSGAFIAQPFGASGDFAATGDYDGDGKEDISVFRPSNGTWYRLNSSSGALIAQPFGQNGDRPAPSAFQY